MIKLTSAQLQAFSQLRENQFEERALRRIQQFFVSCRNLSEADGKKLVRLGRARAAIHGITSERDVAKYIGLMVVLGEDFDSIPRYASILSDAEIKNQEKLVYLYEKATSPEATWKRC